MIFSFWSPAYLKGRFRCSRETYAKSIHATKVYNIFKYFQPKFQSTIFRNILKKKFDKTYLQHG